MIDSNLVARQDRALLAWDADIPGNDTEISAQSSEPRKAIAFATRFRFYEFLMSRLWELINELITF